MKLCPECAVEYVDSAETCADCGCGLVDEAAFEKLEANRQDDRWVPLCPVADHVEAEGLLNYLAEEGIDTHLRRFEENIHIGFSDMHQGYGLVLVPASVHARAARLIEE